MANAIRFTNRTETVENFFADIRKYPILSKSEEMELFAKAKAGDESAYDAIINSNLRYVIGEAKKYSTDPVIMCDLIQVGAMGMVECIRDFDATRGYKFITYATHYINMEMRTFINKQSIRQSNNTTIAPKVRKIRKEFFNKNYREPSTDEIIEILENEGIKVKDVRDVLTLTISSINTFVGDDDDRTEEENSEFAMATAYSNGYEDIIENDDKDYENKKQVAKLLKKLGNDSRAKEFVILNFGLNGCEPMEYEAIADRYGICKERVRQIIKAATRKMAM